MATIGFFDGVHVGHRFLLDRLKAEAKQRGKKSLVISFDVHPKTILSTNYLPPLLSTNEEKLQLISKCGVDNCVFLHFSREMASLTAYEFLKSIIVEQLGVDTLLIGYDHRFGHNREEGFDDYIRYGKELGLHVLHAGSYNVDDRHISSSVIRRLLLNGKVEDANSLLCRPYSLKGIVVNGRKIGRTIGYPTANIKISDELKLIPESGVYAVKVLVQGRLYKGMLNIGKRPTVSRSNKVFIEVYLVDFKQDIYNEDIEVIFCRRLRAETKFKNLESLTQQLREDERVVREMKWDGFLN